MNKQAEPCTCGECKHWANGTTKERPCHKTGAYPMKAEDYCSYGERKESEVHNGKS